MNTRLPGDYDVSHLERVTTRRFEFDLWITPRFKDHFEVHAYEEMTALLVRQMARRAACFIDIGAHFGFYSVLVGRSNPDCSILVFEPIADNAAILRKNLELHHVDADVQEVAVSEGSGRMPFQVSRASDNSGFVANPQGGVLTTRDVESVTLDQFRNRIPKGPLIVKIDVEGHEPHVLTGMREILRERDEVCLAIEFNPGCLEANGFSPESLLVSIEDLGFEIFFLHDDLMQVERFRSGKPWQQIVGSKTHTNLLCIPKNQAFHLCFFSHSSGLEGAERSILELVEYLISERWSLCTVVLPSNGPLSRLLSELGAVTLHSDYGWWCGEGDIGEAEARRQMAFGCGETLRLESVVERISPDVVVSGSMVVPWGATVAEKLGVPHIWWVQEFGELDHELDFFLGFDTVLRIIKESSNHIVANSDAVKDFLFHDLGPDRCTVGYYDRIAMQAGSDSRRRFFHALGSTKILFAGRATVAKGLDDAIRATKRLVDTGCDVELCVIGNVETPFGRKMRQLADDLNLAERVHFCGFVDNVSAALEQADIGLMCSRCEAFGRITAESMLLGKPMIGTNTGGTVELIDDGVTGFLYTPGDVEGLAEKVRFFIDRPDAVREFGDRARAAIVGKIAGRPVSELMYALGRRYTGAPNPGSRELLLALVEWQSGRIEDMNDRHDRMTEALSEETAKSQEQRLRLAQTKTEFRRTQSWARDLEVQVTDRDAHVSQLETYVQSLESELRAHDGRIGWLEAELKAREDDFGRLELHSKELAEQTDSLRVELSERDEGLARLKSEAGQLTAQVGGLRSELKKRDDEIEVVNGELEKIRNSRAWRIADSIWRFRVVVAPPGSLRARLLQRFGF